MSKLTAVAYYNGIPPNNSNLEKPKILDYFIEGVRKTGDIGISHTGMNVIPCDVALIQGFVHEQGKNLPHLTLRKSAIDLQKSTGKKSLIVDSNLFLYINKENPLHYLRYSFDGVFPTTGFYFDKEIDHTRWQKISKDLNLSLKDWRNNGSNILLCVQRTGGWSMQGLSTIDWINSTINKITQHTDRHIVIRTHPGDKKINSVLKISHKNVSLSKNVKLTDDLRTAWATVVYNSSPSVASVIEGIPTFITDPVPQHSQTFRVGNTDISKIENPNMPDRLDWVQRLSMCHWKFDELRSGEAWQFFKRYI
jgi:hypothetical protein